MTVDIIINDALFASMDLTRNANPPRLLSKTPTRQDEKDVFCGVARCQKQCIATYGADSEEEVKQRRQLPEIWQLLRDGLRLPVVDRSTLPVRT